MSALTQFIAVISTAVVVSACSLQYEFKAPSELPPAPDPAEAYYTTVGSTIMTRQGIYSKLTSIFTDAREPVASPNTTRVRNILQPLFTGTNAMNSFGGPCTPAATTDQGECRMNRSFTQLATAYAPTSIAEGYITRACYNLLRAETISYRSTSTPNPHQVPLEPSNPLCEFFVVDASQGLGRYECYASEPNDEHPDPCQSRYRNFILNGGIRVPLPNYQHNITTCPEIPMANDAGAAATLMAVATKVGASATDPLNYPTSNQIAQLYRLFHSDSTVHPVALRGLENISSAAVSNGLQPPEAWGHIVFTLCVSNSWRLLR